MPYIICSRSEKQKSEFCLFTRSLDNKITMLKQKILITTAIPYVNAPPHIGHALEYIETDTFARYQKSIGNNIFFLTGADENSLKNVQSAEKEGISTNDLVDRNSTLFQNFKKEFNLSWDGFIRTTEPRHFEGAQKLWKLCEKDIYKKNYKGFYCVGCESFYLEKDLIDGFCPEHKTKPEIIEEENYFFKLSNYQNKIYKLISEDKLKITPEKRKNEILNFIKRGLEDFSVSRSKERAKGWGVPVPNDDSQIMYVWFDALANYITGLDFSTDGDLYKNYWQNADKIIHIIGKGITRFHAIYWPAMLLSAGLKLPIEIFAHGYITIEGEKMSKSLGNTINPFEISQKYGIDALRFYLLKEIPPYDDGDFSLQRFIDHYNGDLANGLGNLVSRVLALAKKVNIENINEIEDVEEKINETWKKIKYNLDIFKFNEALNSIWELISFANQYVNSKEPWKKSGKELNIILSNLLYLILHLSWQLKPFLPETSEKILNKLGIEKESDLNIKSLKISGDTTPLFQRIQ